MMPLRVDAHVDVLSRLLVRDPGAAPAWPNGEGHVDPPRMRAGGFDCWFFPLYTPSCKPFAQANAPARTLAMLRIADRIAAERGDEVAWCRSVAQVRAAAAEGRIALVLTMENGVAFEDSLEVFELYVERFGVRALGLVWNGANRLGSGVGHGGTDDGLTDFGRRVVDACERLGVLVDLSHLNPAGVADVLDCARGPVVATHSNAHALCPHPRNLTDEQIRGIAATGGVIGLNACPDFLVAGNSASVDDLVRHARHIAEVGGAACLGVGTDFDGIDGVPRGLPDAGAMGALADGLERAGFTGAELEGILGENWLRVAERVWRS